jgi:hypothetical protein
MSKHTPKPSKQGRYGEPWAVDGLQLGHKWNISDALETDMVLVQQLVGDDLKQSRRSEIARRVTACVNACKGITTEALECQAKKGLTARLIEERAELLAALETAKMGLLEASQPHLVPGLFATYEVVRDAINKAKDPFADPDKGQFRVKATKDDGEVYYIYDGSVYESRKRAQNEADGCNKQWPHIKFEVEEYIEADKEREAMETARRQFFLDIMSTAIEGGIDYWAAVDEVDRDKDGEYLFFKVRDSEDRTDPWRAVSPLEIEAAIEKIKAGSVKVADHYLQAILKAEADMENMGVYIDADVADTIVQVAAYGEVVFS